ncbi:MAG: response regulator [Verrucomicrobiota bacterium]|nr:response regulator [Verrucomicrobiota bacterium]
MIGYGGNTSCVEVRVADEILILDAGTGIRALGEDLTAEFAGRGIKAALLFSHTHWDHIQGLPFFAPAYSSDNRIQLLAANGSGERLAQALRNQTDAIHFPVGLEQMQGLLPVQELGSGKVSLGVFDVLTTELKHPGGCNGFRVTAGGASIAYLPDHEPFVETSPAGVARAQALSEFVRGVDLLILDTQYTEEEYPRRIGWGHGCLPHSVALALAAQVRELALFHLDPNRTDIQVREMVQSARQLARGSKLVVRAAAETEEIILGADALLTETSERHKACIEMPLPGRNSVGQTTMNDKLTALNGHEGSPAIASELNNLLQIIAGTSALIENIWEGKPGADKYFEMLRSSVARAADVTRDLVELSGSMNGKIVLHPEFARARKPPAPQPRSALKQRIMVVDDEKMLLILTGELLREAGFEVVTAESGFECLDVFRVNPSKFDLVLLDLNMPLMDGEETFQRLRGLRPDVRVLLCTGCVQQERLNHMLEAGLCGFIQKPLGPGEYVSSVRAILAKAAFSQADPVGNFASVR